MADNSEIVALKAALRGAASTADSLGALRGRIEALDPGDEIPASDLDDLVRAAAAHAIASAALRGLVETIRSRRS